MAHTSRRSGGIRMREYRLGWHRKQFCAVYYDENGKRHRPPLGTTDRAKALLAIEDLKALEARQSASGGQTVADVYGAYMKAKEGQPPHARIADIWKAIGPHFGHLRPDAIDEAKCREYAERRKAQGRSVGTVHTELGYLRTALSWAVKRHRIERMPFVWLPPKPRPRDRRLTREEADRLIESAGKPHVKLFMLIALGTAGRAAAILELTWDRVDFKRGMIYLDNPERDRTRKGRASVPMTEEVREALEEAKAGALTDHVIEWGGKPVLSIKKGVKEAARRAGLDDVSPHVLRHSAASWMAEDGVSMQEIAAVLGHTDSRTTERVYARLSPSYLRKAISSLERRR